MTAIEAFKYPYYATLSNMERVIQIIKEEEKVKKICADNALNLNLLHDLFELQMKGFNNKQVAEKLGVHRVTIQRYANTLRHLQESEFKVLYNYILMEEKDE